MADIIHVSDSRNDEVFCEGCGRRLEKSADLRARCVVCGKRLCGSCVKESNGKLYCEEHKPGCFIATAAYGTPIAKEIDVLRKWRDVSLIKTTSGKIFVNSYYKASPPIAFIISKSGKLKRLTRILLKPLIYHFNDRFQHN